MADWKLGDFLLNDRIKKNARTSRFSQELEKTLRKQKVHAGRSRDLVKFWFLSFLYTLPSFGDYGLASNRENHLVVYDEMLKFYFVKETVQHVVDSVVFVLPNTSSRTNTNFCFTQNPVLGFYNGMQMSMRVYKIINPTDSESGYSVEAKTCKTVQRNQNMQNVNVLYMENKKPDVQLAFKDKKYLSSHLNLNHLLDQIVKLNQNAKLTKMSMNSSEFLLTALEANLLAHYKPSLSINAVFQTDPISSSAIEGLWVTIRNLPPIFFQFVYPDKRSLSKMQTVKQTAFTSETFVQTDILFDGECFMFRTREKSVNYETGFFGGTSKFLLAKNLAVFLPSLENYIYNVVLHNPKFDMTNFLLGRLIGDQMNLKYYKLSVVVEKSEKLCTIFFESFVNSLEIDIKKDECSERHFCRQQLDRHVIKSLNLKNYQLTQPKNFKAANLTLNVYESYTLQQQPLSNCIFDAKVLFFPSQDLYRTYDVIKFFSCSACIARIVSDVISYFALNFEEAQSLISGILVGMFPVHSFLGQDMVIHTTKDPTVAYLLKIITIAEKTTPKMAETMKNIDTYVSETDLKMSISAIFIVLQESRQKTMLLDSVCLQVNNKATTCDRFQINNFFHTLNGDKNIRVTSSSRVSVGLIKDNRKNGKLPKAEIASIVEFSKAIEKKPRKGSLNYIHSLLVYAQISENVLAFAKIKLASLGYKIRDTYNLVSQLLDPIDGTNPTLFVPTDLFGVTNSEFPKLSETLLNIPVRTMDFRDSLIDGARKLSDKDYTKFIYDFLHFRQPKRKNYISNPDRELAIISQNLLDDFLDKSVQYYLGILPRISYISLSTVEVQNQCYKIPRIHESRQDCSYSYQVTSKNIIDTKAETFCAPKITPKVRPNLELEGLECSNPSTLANMTSFISEDTITVSVNGRTHNVALFVLLGDKSIIKGLDNQNIFILGKGTKSVIGGGKNDVTVLNHPHFSGFIDGQGGRNTLILKYQLDDQDFQRHTTVIRGKSLTKSSIEVFDQNNILKSSATLLNIHTIIGNKNLPEKLENGCKFTTVDLQGGNGNKWDEITISYDEAKCASNTMIILESFTTINFIGSAWNNRSIQVDVKNGPVRIENVQHEKNRGAIFIQAKFYDLRFMGLEHIDQNRFNIAILYKSLVGDPFIFLKRCSKLIRLKFIDYTLETTGNQFSLQKNSENHEKISFLLDFHEDQTNPNQNIKWFMENEAIYYYCSQGLNVITKDLFWPTVTTNQYSNNVFVVENPNTTIVLDKEQSLSTNIFELRFLKISDTVVADETTVKVFIAQTQYAGGYNKISILKKHKQTNHNEPLVNLYFWPDVEPKIQFVTQDNRIYKLVWHKLAFELMPINLGFGGHDENSKNIYLMTRQTMQNDHMKKFLTKIDYSNMKKTKQHGNLMIETKNCTNGQICGNSIILWQYAKLPEEFEEIVKVIK